MRDDKGMGGGYKDRDIHCQHEYIHITNDNGLTILFFNVNPPKTDHRKADMNKINFSSVVAISLLLLLLLLCLFLAPLVQFHC